jgi:hypothetical protein
VSNAEETIKNRTVLAKRSVASTAKSTTSHTHKTAILKDRIRDTQTMQPIILTALLGKPT